MYTKILVQMTIFAMIFNSFVLTPTKAHGMTVEEVIKFVGVLQRYITDIDNTFGTPSQPETKTPQPKVLTPETGSDHQQTVPDINEKIESN